MSLNELTISEAGEKLRAKEIKATELTEACLAAIEAGNKALNAFLVVTADKAMEAAKESDKRLGAKAQRAFARSKAFRSASRISTAPRACARPRARTSCTISSPPTNRPSRRTFGTRARSCSASSIWTSSRWAPPTRRAISGRASARGAPRAAGKSSCPAGRRAARRRLSRPALPRRNGVGYRRLDPPAGRIHRHGRHQAHLRPLLALGHDRIRVLARSGRAARPLGQGRGAAPPSHGEPRSEGLRPAPTCLCPISRRRSASR